MSYLSYKIRTFFQNFSYFFSLKYRSYKEEYRFENNVFEIRKSYDSVLKSLFFSKMFRTSATALGALFIVGFVVIEGGSFLVGKIQKGLSSVQVVEANVAPMKIPEPVAVVKEIPPVLPPKVVQEIAPAKKQPEIIQKKIVVKKVIPQVPQVTVPPEERYIILVNKGDKTLKLAEFLNGKYFVVEEFDVSIGKLMGPKTLEGDLRTPVGKYKILQVKKDRELHSQYGPFAFVLNYPNERDLSLGKTGNGIWIHGSGSNTRSPETKGCIELGNSDLVRLRNYIQVKTPVYIFPSDPVGMNNEQIDLAAIDTLKNYLDTL